MPRVPKPFFHRGWWVTDVGGQRTKLVHGQENRKQADQLFHELLAKAEHSSSGKTVFQLAVWELSEKFLAWVEIHRDSKTLADYHTWLKRWVAIHGRKRARDIRPLHLEDWKADLVKMELKPCTVNHAIIAVQTAWNWAVRNELLPGNPLTKVEKLFTEGRQRVLTPGEFRLLLRHSDATFRQVLLVLRLTGARPGELRKLTWGDVSFEHHCWVLRKHKTTRTTKERKPRIIPMPPAIENLLRWRQRRFGPTSRVFLNRFGRPWTNNALRCRMKRLREKAAILPDANGETLVLYSARHSYATAAIAAGVSDKRLSELLGHADSKMMHRYVHLCHSDLYKASQEATATVFPRKTGS